MAEIVVTNHQEGYIAVYGIEIPDISPLKYGQVQDWCEEWIYGETVVFNENTKDADITLVLDTFNLGKPNYKELAIENARKTMMNALIGSILHHFETTETYGKRLFLAKKFTGVERASLNSCATTSEYYPEMKYYRISKRDGVYCAKVYKTKRGLDHSE